LSGINHPRDVRAQFNRKGLRTCQMTCRQACRG
jgi:hypothetical protein